LALRAENGIEVAFIEDGGHLRFRSIGSTAYKEKSSSTKKWESGKLNSRNLVKVFSSVFFSALQSGNHAAVESLVGASCGQTVESLIGCRKDF
jgi:hypothetical protein